MRAENQKFPTDGSVPSAEQIRKALQSPAGQQLLRLVSSSHAGELQRAMTLWRQGDTEGAKAALSPILDMPQAAELLQQITGQCYGRD